MRNTKFVMSDITEILEKVYRERGFDFRQYKETSLERRLQKRLHALNLKSYKDYLVRLSEDPTEYDRLIDTLLINVTEFFRDQDAFDVIRDKVLPDVMEGKEGKTGERAELKIWSAGCATGEEAYSMAILLNEMLGNETLSHDCWQQGICKNVFHPPKPCQPSFAKATDGPPRHSSQPQQATGILAKEDKTDDFEFSICGTDIDKDSLEKAKEAAYRIETVDGKIANEILDKYFVKNGSLRVKDFVKRNCRFMFHDLVQDRPLEAMDIILCRNVAIYFERALQEKIYMDFFNALNKKGYLFLGKAETLIGPAQGRFKVIDKRWKIYKKEG